MKNFDPATSILHSSQVGANNGVNHAICDSATFSFNSAQEMTDCFAGNNNSFLYSRHWNPTNLELSKTLAKMEDTEAAWVTGSGMSAITTTILHLTKPGDHIISTNTSYGGTFAFFKNYLSQFNIEVSFVNITDLDEIKKAIKPNTKVIYTETITNPMLQVSDIPSLSVIAHQSDIKLVVDNTFSPMIFSPARLGADVVVYSMTKFINGKNDCVAGAICSSADFINELIDVNTGTAMLLGPVLDPLRAASIHKNLFTLHIRMKQHSLNAMFLSKKFQELDLDIIYPGLKEHPGHELMSNTMNSSFGFGGILAIDLGNAEDAGTFMRLMQEKGIGFLAVSLGYFKTLFSNSGKSTSSEVPEDLQKEFGIPEGLVRFSVGLDNDIEKTYEIIESCLKEMNILKPSLA